jgi:hypothetical protein
LIKDSSRFGNGEVGGKLRTRLLTFVIALGLALTGCGHDKTAGQQRIWGAFTERSFQTVAMKPGINVRVFNDVSLDAQDYIKYDKATGYLTLEPGTYRFNGWSLTSFGINLTPEQRAATFSAPGYAFVFNADEKKMEILGSISDPFYSLTSVLDGVIKVAKTTRYYLGHQNGDKVTGVIIEFFDPKITMPDGQPSTNHAFAQLVVERL